jgi:hypothetical protein
MAAVSGMNRNLGFVDEHGKRTVSG